MRKKNHPVFALIGVFFLIGFLYLKGAFIPWSDNESKSETVETEVTVVETEVRKLSADENRADNETEHVHAGLKPVQEAVVPATCTVDGGYEEVVYCTCGEELSRENISIPATGHSYYVEQSIDATCLDQGYTVYTCSVCQNSYTDNYTDVLGHHYVEGICERCSAKDPDYTKVYNSNEIVTALSENLVNDTGSFTNYLNGETISVFAEDQSDCFSINTAVSYNLWGNNVQSVTFNVAELASKMETLYFNVAGETGTSGTVNIEIFLDKTVDEEPDCMFSIECSAIPTAMAIDIGGATSLAIRVTNCSNNQNRVVFYDFSSAKPV